MRTALAAFCTAILAGTTVVPAAAQSSQSAYQRAFADRVANPGNTSALSTFINVAVEAGQYDQALSTIEQHLINYPLDAKAHLVAARLYNHVGSYDLSARHLEFALEIGTLEERDRRAAERLLRTVERAIAGISGYLDLTAGVRSESIDFAPTAPWADRTDINGFLLATGQLRFDLDTSTNNAIVLSGKIGTRRRFGDFNFDGVGGVYTAPHGTLAATLDIGLPTEMLPTLRGQLTVYGSHETFDAGLYRRIYGVMARLTALPTADSFVYVEAGYGWLGESAAPLLEDNRVSFEAGATYRIVGSHTIGIAGRGQIDYLNGFGRVGHLYEVELSYAGQVHAFTDGPVWTQQAGLAYGDVQVPNIVLGPAFPYVGDYWLTYWTHSLQIDENNRIDLDLTYRETTYSNLPIRNQSKFDVSLSYTVSLH
ncbi:MAG: hypothetical protein R3D45_15085 [Rhizobiaceae bacterium]